MTKQVADCPRCGSSKISHGFSFPPEQGVVECHVDDCGAMALADSEIEAIEMWNDGQWNYRTVDYDEWGERIIQEDAPTPAAPQSPPPSPCNSEGSS